jgi:hypothetical protein
MIADWKDTTEIDKEIEKAKGELDSANNEFKSAKEAETELRCTDWNCLTESSFMLDTTGTFWLWKSAAEWDKSDWNWTSPTAKQGMNNLLWTIIQKLMIALGTISLLIMSVWAGYIILYHGQDEYLSKWKWIFVAWLTSLVIALSSYLLVSLVRFILYSTTWSGS